jgi:hypothetical protein
MTTWTPDELDRVGRADELEIASMRPEGRLGSPRTIWVVRHGDDLYVRSVNGPSSAWYQGVQQRHEGRVQADGVERDVTLEEVAGQLDDALDAAYRTKYRRYSAAPVDHITSPQARSTTLRLVPRP